MSDPDESLAGSLEAKAARRRGDGTYPDGIDAALEAEVADRLRSASTQTTALRASVARLHDLDGFEVPAYRGSNPVKAVYAKVVGKAVEHALADLVRQLEAHRDAVERVLDALVAEVEDGDHIRP